MLMSSEDWSNNECGIFRAMQRVGAFQDGGVVDCGWRLHIALPLLYKSSDSQAAMLVGRASRALSIATTSFVDISKSHVCCLAVGVFRLSHPQTQTF